MLWVVLYLAGVLGPIESKEPQLLVDRLRVLLVLCLEDEAVCFLDLVQFLYRMLEWEDIYTPGLMYITVTFTEADSVHLNVNVIFWLF